MANANNVEKDLKNQQKTLAEDESLFNDVPNKQSKDLISKKTKILSKKTKISDMENIVPSSIMTIKDDKKQKESLIKSKKRVKKFGEVFTPEFIVKQMCDLCEPTISQVDKKVFEPTCGNGNFLVEILNRKLNSVPDLYAKIKKQKNARSKKAQQEIYDFCLVLAISNVYAVDIQEDNVEESRKRLKNVIFEHTKKTTNSIFFLQIIDKILDSNIIVGNTLTQKNELKFFDLKPNFDNLTFEVSEYSLQEIEKAYSKTKSANFENLTTIMEQMQVSPPKPIPKEKTKKLQNNKE